MLTHITHIHSCIICTPPPTLCNTDVLLLLVPFLQDDGGWNLVESSLANNKQLQYLGLDGCDAFLLNMGKVLTKDTSIWGLSLHSESLYCLLITPIQCVCLRMMWQWTLSHYFLPLGVHTHTLPFVLYVPVCESVLVQYRYM